MYLSSFPKITSKDTGPWLNFHVRDSSGWYYPQFVVIEPNYWWFRMAFPSIWLQVVYDGGPPYMWNDYGGYLEPFNELIPFP